MPDDVLHDLPDEITFDLGEDARLLSLLDDAAEIATGSLLQRIDLARRSLVAKLWPELGDLLDDDDG